MHEDACPYRSSLRATLVRALEPERSILAKAEARAVLCVYGRIRPEGNRAAKPSRRPCLLWGVPGPALHSLGHRAPTGAIRLRRTVPAPRLARGPAEHDHSPHFRRQPSGPRRETRATGGSGRDVVGACARLGGSLRAPPDPHAVEGFLRDGLVLLKNCEAGHCCGRCVVAEALKHSGSHIFGGAVDEGLEEERSGGVVR